MPKRKKSVRKFSLARRRPTIGNPYEKERYGIWRMKLTPTQEEKQIDHILYSRYPIDEWIGRIEEVFTDHDAINKELERFMNEDES